MNEHPPNTAAMVQQRKKDSKNKRRAVLATVEAMERTRSPFSFEERPVGVCDTWPMITEHALLPVISGLEKDFEAAFDQARLIIASMPGFVSLSLSRSIETPATYLLLVQWESLEDHTVGFRGSPEYLQWGGLLHRFYEPFPLVEHYELVNSATR